jgi:hypothetical protein
VDSGQGFKPISRSFLQPKVSGHGLSVQAVGIDAPESEQQACALPLQSKFYGIGSLSQVGGFRSS